MTRLALPEGYLRRLPHLCAHCAHWHRFAGPDPSPTSPWGWCTRPIETSHVAAPFPPDWGDNDRLHVHEEFGCNRWEPAE